MEHYLIVSGLLVLLSFVYIKLAEYFNILDIPNIRSSHTIPVIRGGGVLFLIAVWIFFFFSGFQYPYFVLGITLISGISFIDDLKTLSVKVRMPFQIASIVFILIETGLLEIPIWGIVLILIAGVGALNIFNFMDGINGITGMYSLTILISLFFINKTELLVNQDLIGFTILSVLVFGFYNFRRRARFFAGDIGSISIAMIVVFVIAFFVYKFTSPLFLLLTVVYGTDGILTIVHRKIRGDKLTDPHREHIYQKLVDVKKLSHLKVSLFYAIAQSVASLIVVLCYKFDLLLQFIIFVSVCLVYMLTYVILFKKTKVSQQ